MGASRRPINARQTKWAGRIANALAAKGIRPNQISIASIFFACAAGLSLAGSIPSAAPLKSLCFVLATLFIQGRLLCNLFDGMVAVEGGFKTRSGAIYNDLPDRIADPLILIAMGYAAGTATLGWLAGLLAVITAYTRFLGVAAGATEYFIGPMAKQHRMAVCSASLVAAAVFPGQHAFTLSGALLLICGGCAATVIRRTRRIIRELETE